MTGLGWASAYQVAAAIRRRDVSAAEVLVDQLDRIQRHDARLRSVVTLDANGARRRAAEADRRWPVARCAARCTGSGSPWKTCTPRRGCAPHPVATVLLPNTFPPPTPPWWPG
jgi:hypothetical protein